LSKIIRTHQDYIAAELLADKLEQTPPPAGAYVKEWNINGEIIGLWVIRV
jgi:hypothetical protein